MNPVKHICDKSLDSNLIGLDYRDGLLDIRLETVKW